jgi:DNA-binding LytR/AlgR family response regulator
MKDTEEALSQYHFYRIGKSYLVNPARVDAIQGGNCVIQGEALPISRQKKKEFMETLSRYMAEVM